MTGEYALPRAQSDRRDPALPANDPQQADLGSHLVVSPYSTLPHLLDLRTLEESQRLSANALTLLQSVREDYATAPYHQSFNWDAVVDRLKSLIELSKYQWKRQSFYVVVFRSQIPPTTDRVYLGGLDQKSHAEATKSGGLLKYWFGLPDEVGRNLATCIWCNSADARSASVGPGHKEAMRASTSMYTELKLERLRLEIGDGAKAWSITPWED
ncbi:MAG: hypothetical protein Q9161_004316 [Pseudevernia consocians]